MALVRANELPGQQVKEKAVLPDTEAVAQVLPRDTDGPKASPAKASDRRLVLSLWVDHKAVKAEIVDQVRAQDPHRLESKPAAVHRRIEEEIEAGKSDDRLLFRVPLGEADDPLVEHDGVVGAAVHIGGEVISRVLPPAPHLGFEMNLSQSSVMLRSAWDKPHARPGEGGRRRHPLIVTGHQAR